MALRAIPHLRVLRPGDANEIVEAWRVALERTRRPDRPRALAPGRCPCSTAAVLAPAEGVRRGGYVLADADGGARR